MRPATRYQDLYATWVVWFVLWTFLLLANLIEAGKSGGPFPWKTSLFSWLLWICYLFFCLWLRRGAQAEKKASPDVAQDPKPRKSSFFWQGILILLPVALMAGFGFWAILRERNAVEQDARQRAQEIIQSLPADFDRIAANRLTQFEAEKNGWHNHLEYGLALWPESAERKKWLAMTNEFWSATNNLAILRAAFPDILDGPFPPVRFGLTTNGDIAFGGHATLRPPAWLLTMSAGQYQGWAALETSASSESFSNWDGLFNAFQQTQPPPPALACARFLRLRAESAALPATNAISQLLQFADHHYDVISDSGIPLPTLALAEAVKRAQSDRPTEGLWERLQAEVSSPNVLTPMLLKEVARLASGDVQLLESINALRILLADKQEQFELAEAVRQTGKLNGLTTTNLWVNALNQRWFCIVSPAEARSGTSVSNHAVWTTIPYTDVACYPKSSVIRGFADALKDARISLPDYFSITLELEGQPVPLPVPWSKLDGGPPAGDLLAEEHYQMRQPAFLPQADPGKRPKEPMEAMPGHPQFTLQIRLTNRTLLFAQARQLQFIFGTLIAASTLAALIGFAAAYRAFRRQQELSELKSNFVSSVSHELRAPIASVRLMAENLEGGKIPAADKQQEYYQFIVQECRRLSSLIENVLDFSRIEQGRKQYEFEPTDLSALTQTTVRLMEPYAREKGVALRLETPTEDAAPKLELNLDGRAIQQALVNLLDNAIKHSAKGEVVTIGMERKNEIPTPVAHLWVADQGPGIPKAEQEKIFERFYRRGSELRRETQGIGIGLSLVKHIVEAHGGRVLVASEPGQGSRFTIELPIPGKVC